MRRDGDLRQAGDARKNKNVSGTVQKAVKEQSSERTGFPLIEAYVRHARVGNENGHKNAERAPRTRIRGGDRQNLLSFAYVNKKKGNKPIK